MRNLPLGARLLILIVVIGIWIFAPGGNVPTTKKACMLYIKQLGQEVLLYAHDHDDRFPLADSWRTVTDHQQDSPWRCPESKAPFTYAMNRELSGRGELDTVDPFRTVLLFDCDSNDKNKSAGQESLAYHHKGAAVILTSTGSARTTATRTPFIWKPK